MLDPQPIPQLTTPAPVKRTNVVWRFYVDEQGAWRWQQLGSDHGVLCDSAESYASYDDCVLGAQIHGYSYTPSQKKVGQPPRTYTHVDRWR